MATQIPIVDTDGTIRYYNSLGQLHRDGDLPAVIDTPRTKLYHQNGQLHYNSGKVEYYQNGQRHRNGDLPAVIFNDGKVEYYQNGQFHRDGDHPAVVHPDGTLEYYKNGHQYTPNIE